MTKQFEQVKPLINGIAYRYAKKYRLDKDEVKSQAYEEFCKVIDQYDPNKGELTTFVHSKLLILTHYCKREKENPFFASGEMLIEDTNQKYFDDEMEKLETGLELSEDAQEVLSFIIGREWETPGISKCLPRLSYTIKWMQYNFDWKFDRTKRAWEEIKVWWTGSCKMEV